MVDAAGDPEEDGPALDGPVLDGPEGVVACVSSVVVSTVGDVLGDVSVLSDV